MWQGKIPQLAFLLYFINNLRCSSLKILCICTNPLWRSDLLSERGPALAVPLSDKNGHLSLLSDYMFLKGSQYLELGYSGIISETTFLETEADINQN